VMCGSRTVGTLAIRVGSHLNGSSTTLRRVLSKLFSKYCEFFLFNFSCASELS
jgi:hypothetical protein